MKSVCCSFWLIFMLACMIPVLTTRGLDILDQEPNTSLQIAKNVLSILHDHNFLVKGLLLAGGLWLLLSLVHLCFVVSQTWFNQLGLGDVPDKWGNILHEEGYIEQLTTTVMSAVASGECLQRMSCQLGRVCKSYHHTITTRVLHALPRSYILDAFHKGARGYDCKIFFCHEYTSS